VCFVVKCGGRIDTFARERFSQAMSEHRLIKQLVDTRDSRRAFKILDLKAVEDSASIGCSVAGVNRRMGINFQ